MPARTRRTVLATPPLASITACLLCVLATRDLRGQLPLATIDSIVRAERAANRVPGIALAVVRRDSVLLARGWGEANVEHAVPVTDATIFQSGSIGKQFTAVLVMLLVEEGKLALDAPIARYLPSAPPRWRGITLRHLLTHTSGIPDYTPQQIDYRRDYTDAELTRIAASLPLEFPPGTQWNYSNTGYLLLGVIITRVTGRFYGDLLGERVFTPLGMTTARIISESAIVPNRAAGYELARDSLRNQSWVSPQMNTTADGSLYLSLRDYIAWDRGLRRGALLSAAGWREVYTPVKLASGHRYPYGFGWHIDTIGGQTVYEHGGSWQGFQTMLIRFQGDQLTIVALANLAEANPERLARAVAAAMNPALVSATTVSSDSTAEPTLRALLAKVRAGQLSRRDFAWVRAGFFPSVADAYRVQLRALGEPEAVELTRSGRVGNDQIFEFTVRYPTDTLSVRYAQAPDGRLTRLAIWRSP